MSKTRNVINGFNLGNAEKLNRAIYGTIGRNGALSGGVGEDASDEAVIAEYDRLGGLITNEEGAKVKTGSFYDFENKEVREEPEITYVFRDIDGEEVELNEGEDVPKSVRAAEAKKKKDLKKIQDAAAKKEKAKAAKKAKGKKGADEESVDDVADEDEGDDI